MPSNYVKNKREGNFCEMAIAENSFRFVLAGPHFI